MLIEQKLILSQVPVVFIHEGGFIKVYNQSLYIVVTQLGYPLQPHIKYIKKIDRTIVYGGLPARHLLRCFPAICQTPFGYQLSGCFDLSGYQTWFLALLNKISLPVLSGW